MLSNHSSSMCKIRKVYTVPSSFTPFSALKSSKTKVFMTGSVDVLSEKIDKTRTSEERKSGTEKQSKPRVEGGPFSKAKEDFSLKKNIPERREGER